MDGSQEGYALALRNGRLEAWYYRDASDYVRLAESGGGAFIADGQWHHLAFVVTTNSGQIFVDHVFKSSRGWTGTASATKTLEIFRMGRYSEVPGGYFAGQIDQPTIWNLDLSTIMSQRWRFVPSGNESGLKFSWNLDEGTGTTSTSTAPLIPYQLYFVNDPTWVVSTAPIGPAPAIATLLPRAIRGGNATLRGNINPEGVDATAWFEWGPVGGPAQPTTPMNIGAGTNFLEISNVLSGLVANTDYYFRAVVTNEFGRMQGVNFTFNSSDLLAFVGEYTPDLAVLGSPAWGDFDNDGDLDLLLMGSFASTTEFGELYILRNDNGRFTKVTLATNLYGGTPPVWVDFDGDGDLDILALGNDAGRLYRNDGGVFTREDVGLPGGDYYGYATFADVDNDGDLDLLMVKSDKSTVLFRNDGGHFSDMRSNLPRLTEVDRGSLAWADYDNDGDMDLATIGEGNGGFEQAPCLA